MIVIVDNYDSFTYNLVHLIAQSVAERVRATTEATTKAATKAEMEATAIESRVAVFRNDCISVSEVEALNPAGILISPGPGRPADAGICRALIEQLGLRIPILGVCLGHQAIGEVFGGSITYAPTLMHGKTSLIRHDGDTIFANLATDFIATRYHSLVVSKDGLPDCLQISASTPDGVIMGLRHNSYPLEGIQFHPESLLTVEGPKLISNWVNSLPVTA